jgi:hypothetical protein
MRQTREIAWVSQNGPTNIVARQRNTNILHEICYVRLDIDLCLPLLGMEIQDKGKPVVWFSSKLESGIQRWAAIYRYRRMFYAHSTDAGQTGPYEKITGAFGVAISNVDISTLKIGVMSMLAYDFIHRLRKELKSAKCEIPGLSLERIEALSKTMPPDGHIENNASADGVRDKIIHHGQSAHEGGSIFKLWSGQDPEEWGDNFTELLDEHSRVVYAIAWDSGAPGAGADTECVEKFLDRYWPRTTTDGISGPYETLKEIFDDDNQPFRFVSSAVENISSCEMTIEEILPKLIIYESFDPGYTMKINDKLFKMSEDSRLIPV